MQLPWHIMMKMYALSLGLCHILYTATMQVGLLIYVHH